MQKGKVRKTRFLLGSALLVATSIATLSLASGPAHAVGTGCVITGEGTNVPVGNEWIDGAYTVVVRDGKVYHRRKIYMCTQDDPTVAPEWVYTGRFVDLEVSVIGCCPDDPGTDPGHDPILT